MENNQHMSEKQRTSYLENMVLYYSKRCMELEEKLTSSSFQCKNDILFSDFILKWLSIWERKIQQNTLDSYLQIAESRTIPYFREKGITLQKITASDIDAFYSYLSSLKLSANTILHYHANIYSCLKYAFNQNLIPENVATKVTLPKKQKYISGYYNIEEYNSLLSLLSKSHKTQLFLAVLFGGVLGLRRSEVVGLKWSDFNFIDDSVTITRKVVVGIKNSSDIYVSQKMKTESSRRTLIIPIQLRLVLFKFYNNLNFKQKEADFIFINKNYELINPARITESFGRYLKSNSLKKIRFHDLRHTCASLLIKMGTPMKNVQAWLGHSDYSTTANTYAHIDLKTISSVAQEYNSVLIL